MSRRIPRIEMDAMQPELREALRPRVQRLGYLGEFFKCAANQPAALLTFMTLTEDLKQALPDRVTEVVALTVAAAMGNEYEQNQHERLSVKLGFSEKWVDAVNGRARDGSLAPAEGAVQDLALAMLARDGQGVMAELERVVDEIGPEQAVAVLLLVGRYVTHALFVNALELTPPVPSIFPGRARG